MLKKMKNKFRISLLTLGLSALLFAGCSKAPQAEIDETNMAIQEAAAAEADLYAKDNYVALTDSMNSVMVLIESKKSKFIASYSDEKEKLLQLKEYALEIKDEAAVAKQQMKDDITMMVAEVKTRLDENRALIAQAPRGKEGTTALLAIKEEVNVIDNSLTEVEGMVEKGLIIPAHDKVKAAKEKAASINAELTAVIAKYKANVRK